MRLPMHTPATVLLIAGLVGCATAPPVPPVPGAMHHYRIPWANAYPSDAVVDSRGRLWFTDRQTHAIGMYDPTDGTFRRVPTPTPSSVPYGITRGPGGDLWFGESSGGRLGRLDTATGAITEIPVDLEHGPRLLAWSDGVAWFTSRRDGVVGRYDPRTDRTSIWRERIEEPYGIAVDPDGRVWVGSKGGSSLHRVDLPADSSVVVDYSEPAPVRLSDEALRRLPPERAEELRSRRLEIGMRRVAAGPDGRLWAAGHGRGRVVGVDPDTGDKRTLATLDRRSGPYAVTVDPWGRVWYSEQGEDTVVVYDPRTGNRRRMALPLEGGTVRDVAVDASRGRIWLPLSDIGVIAVIELDSR